MPYQRRWVEALQPIQLKREVAGTSRIEGADFTERELNMALEETPEELLTRSQRQAHAAVKAYRWIARLPRDRPIDVGLIKEVHRILVTGADDDHCRPGETRRHDQNVTFGSPPHRGVEGGGPCEEALERLALAAQREFQDHDTLVQAFALHYHFAAMHPFQDGNGRTARALEALVLQRAGLHDVLFIPMSNYYYDEKAQYLESLARARAHGHDLSPFLVFALKGMAVQCRRVLDEIRREVAKALFRTQMYDLFDRLQSPRRRVIAQRQVAILKLLLDRSPMELHALLASIEPHYRSLKAAPKAMIRDLNGLIQLGAVALDQESATAAVNASVRLEWPTEITETEFFERIRNLPRAKTHPFL
jgi:Fic family protein